MTNKLNDLSLSITKIAGIPNAKSVALNGF